MPNSDSVWDALKAHSKSKFDVDRATFLAQAESQDDGGWTKHTKYHWSRLLNGKRLDYWPSRKKWQYNGKVQRGNVQAFMTNTPHGQVPEALRFTKKPVTIEAIQWTGKNLREVITFTDGPPDMRSHHAGMAWGAYADLVARDGLMIYTLEDGPDRRAKHFADIGDWIIRGVKGEYYPCKPDIFEATYKRAAHVQNPAENEHVVGDVSKNGAELNMGTQQGVAYARVSDADIDRVVPALVEVNEEDYPTEWAIWKDRERIRKELHALRIQQPAPSEATEEVENLRKALVYVAFALHDTPQYMLAQGITLIDGDTVRVSRDGWTVEASVNPHRQPAPPTQVASCDVPGAKFEV